MTPVPAAVCGAASSAGIFDFVGVVDNPNLITEDPDRVACVLGLDDQALRDVFVPLAAVCGGLAVRCVPPSELVCALDFDDDILVSAAGRTTVDVPCGVVSFGHDAVGVFCFTLGPASAALGGALCSDCEPSLEDLEIDIKKFAECAFGVVPFSAAAGGDSDDDADSAFSGDSCESEDIYDHAMFYSILINDIYFAELVELKCFATACGAFACSCEPSFAVV